MEAKKALQTSSIGFGKKPSISSALMTAMAGMALISLRHLSKSMVTKLSVILGAVITT